MQTSKLSDIAANGVFFTVLGGVGIKLMSSLAQLALAWLLLPEDIGLAASAIAIANTAAVIQTGGLHVLLVSKRKGFASWGGQAFYVGILVNSILAITLICVAPKVASIYGQPELFWLISLIALTFPLAQFGLIESAWLVREMRFQTLNSINFVQSIIKFGGQVLLAWLGWGVVSIIFPEIPSLLARLYLVRRFAKRFPLPKPTPRVWYGLWWKSFFLNLSGVFAGIRVNGTILVLATTMTTTGVGLVYWGNNIASQAVFLVAGNLANVIQPLFLRIKDEQGKLDAFHRGTRLLCFVLAPLCMLQAILAKDIIGLVFNERWQNAAQIVAIISVGLVCTPIAVVGQGLMTAGSRYFSLVLANGIYALFVIGSSCAVFFSDDLIVVSCASTVGNSLGSIAFGWMAIQPNRGSLKRVLSDVALPLIGTLIVVALGTYLLTFIENWHSLTRIGLVLTAALFCFAFVLWFRPNQETKWVAHWFSTRVNRFLS